MPVRKVSNRSKRNTIGHFPSIKMKRMIAYESRLECDYIYTLDFEQEVLAFEEQPLSIEYQCEGKTRHYTPDFLVTKVAGSMVVECKPEVFVNSPENRRKFEAGRQWCEAHGQRFQVIVERDLRAGFRLENIKLLTRFARQRVGPEIRARIYDRLYTAEDEVTVQALASYVSLINPTLAIAAILHMAFHHEIILPLDEAKITGDTPVTLTH